MQVKVVIPSRRRPHNVPQMQKLFPGATWCVSESDKLNYQTTSTDRNGIDLLVHPDKIVGIGAKRQWILDKCAKEDAIIMIDDDVSGLWFIGCDRKYTIHGAGEIAQVIENAAAIAEGIGAPVFGFSQAWDVRKFQPLEPFKLNTWIGTAIGFIPRLLIDNRDRPIKYDVELLSQADIDFCLKVLLHRRIVWVDQRFSFVCERFTNVGGSAGIRNMEQYNAQISKVLTRWGKWMTYTEAKTTKRLGISVPRKQKIDI